MKLEALVNAGNFEDALKSPMYTHKTEVEKALDAGRNYWQMEKNIIFQISKGQYVIKL